MTDSFTARYEQWILRKGSSQLKRCLSESYRAAWRSGDEHDRSSALHFVFDQRDAAGCDLVVEGLSSDDFSLARTSAAICLSLIDEGHDMGPPVRQALKEFGERFPDAEVFAWVATKALDDIEGSE